jgi:hypothetical protein
MRTRAIGLLLSGFLWLAAPALALAGDCPDDRGWYCLATWATASPLLAAAMGALLAAAAIRKATKPPSKKLDLDVLEDDIRIVPSKNLDLDVLEDGIRIVPGPGAAPPPGTRDRKPSIEFGEPRIISGPGSDSGDGTQE